MVDSETFTPLYGGTMSEKRLRTGKAWKKLTVTVRAQ
jgi:hypothetical protein